MLLLYNVLSIFLNKNCMWRFNSYVHALMNQGEISIKIKMDLS